MCICIYMIDEDKSLGHCFRVSHPKATQYNFSLSVAAAPPVVRLVAPSSVSTECNFGGSAGEGKTVVASCS